MKQTFVVIAFVFVLINLATPIAWAGDNMNIAYLQAEAAKRDPQIQTAQADINKVIYGSVDADLSVAQLNLLATALYTSSFYIHGTTEKIIGGVAGVVEVGLILMEHLKGRHAKRRLATALSILQARSKQVNTQVEQDYPAFKTGSLPACESLVNLSGPSAVAEVEENLQKNSFSAHFLSDMWHINRIPCSAQ